MQEVIENAIQTFKKHGDFGEWLNPYTPEDERFNIWQDAYEQYRKEKYQEYK